MRVRVQTRRGRPALDDEAGVAVLIVTLALLAICGMLVLVVDVGGLLTLRRRMVTASDSAALAAAQSCAEEQPTEAADQADLLATRNQADATRQDLQTTNCGTSSSGRASVTYSAPKTLAFAPILGYPSERPVDASATAIWGPTGGDTPMPIEFSINPDGLIPCVYQAIGTECTYWWDNSNDHEISSSSNWGFMNLATAGIAPDASCPNAGSSERRDWINGTSEAPVFITGTHTYVCADSGHSSSSWFGALRDQIGEIKHFPVNDPDAMVLTSGKEKYAVVGFVALRVEAVLKGNDPAAIGDKATGSAGKCGKRAPDPNAICLVASWQGVRVGGSLPGNGADFGMRAIRLDE